MKKRLLLISNMYPKNEIDFFGIFVKKFESGIKDYFLIKKCVIYGDNNSIFIKLFKYLQFYVKVFYNIFFNYDVIYVHFPTRSSFPIVLNPIYKRRLIILNYHGSDLSSSSRLNKLFNIILRPFVNHSSLIITPSESLKNCFLKKYENENVFVSPSSGVPDDFYEHQVNNNHNNVISFIYLSSLLENKGIITLLKALELLILNGFKFHCSIYGKGPLLEIVKSFSKINNNFISYNGILQNNKIPKIYSQHDFFIFPSKIESLGLVGLEALACGLPVIGSKIPAIESYLIDGFNGLVFNPNDSDDLAEKISELLTSKELLYFLQINSRASVLEYKSSNVNLKLINKINETIKSCGN